MEREAEIIIALDTETTGLRHAEGHRVIEIGCRKLIRRDVSDAFHVYLNPHREIDQGAIAVHGITAEFLADKPDFQDIYEDFLSFIEGATLVIHNASFDLGFLDMELRRIGVEKKISDYCPVIDTLALARKKYPGQRYYNLDALCKQFNVNRSHRTLHGALVDADLLADVFKAMTRGQFSLFAEKVETTENNKGVLSELLSNRAGLKIIAATDEEVSRHHEFMQKTVTEE